MAEDPKISRRYRELPREEPPRALDEAILAKARRAVASRPAPLLGPGGRGRWYFPLAAAAVIVLAVAVTLQLEREQPEDELVALQDQEETEQALERVEKPQAPGPAVAPPQESKRELRESARADSQYAARPEPAAPPAAASAPMRREKFSAATAGSNFTYASPEQWLQGIADLRKQNRDDEADRQLAEFRKRYPDYRIPKEMLERLELPK
jgi:hypothetical protein